MATFIPVVGKKGTKIKAIIRVKGYKTICKTFSNITRAKTWARKTEAAIEDGSYVDKSKSLNTVINKTNFEHVKDLINYYKDNIAPQKYSYAEKYTVMYNWWIDKIGNVKIKELSASIISSCKQILATEKIKKKNCETVRGNNTINKYLMCLSAVLTYAVKELEIIDINPASKVDIMPKPEGRKRFLSTDEIKKLIEACKNHSDFLYIFVLISLATGGRYSEILKLKLENIDFQNNQVYFLNTKNKEDRGVPIEANILILVHDYINKNNIETYLFWNNKKGKLYYIRGYLQNIIKKIGLKDFHIHDLRHTTASYIAMNGGSLLDIAEILGHKSLIMARRYSHLTEKHTASVLKKVTSRILPEL